MQLTGLHCVPCVWPLIAYIPHSLSWQDSNLLRLCHPLALGSVTILSKHLTLYALHCITCSTISCTSIVPGDTLRVNLYTSVQLLSLNSLLRTHVALNQLAFMCFFFTQVVPPESVSSGVKHQLRCWVWLLLTPSLQTLQPRGLFAPFPSSWCYRAHIPVKCWNYTFITLLYDTSAGGSAIGSCSEMTHQTSSCLQACFPYLAVKL